MNRARPPVSVQRQPRIEWASRTASLYLRLTHFGIREGKRVGRCLSLALVCIQVWWDELAAFRTNIDQEKRIYLLSTLFSFILSEPYDQNPEPGRKRAPTPFSGS